MPRKSKWNHETLALRLPLKFHTPIQAITKTLDTGGTIIDLSQGVVYRAGKAGQITEQDLLELVRWLSRGNQQSDECSEAEDILELTEDAWNALQQEEDPMALINELIYQHYRIKPKGDRL